MGQLPRHSPVLWGVVDAGRRGDGSAYVWESRMIILNIVLVAVAVVLCITVCSTLIWMMYAWRSPATFDSIEQHPDRESRHSFSMIVPCRHESLEVMSHTVSCLLTHDHPDVHVLISVGHDDPETIAHAETLAARDDRVTVSVNHDVPKNKPRQLNSTLADCTGDIVGVMDAESVAAPGLLRRIDQAFTDDIDVVQGAVHLVNTRSQWFSLRNCLEYRFWFRSRLHGHAERGFLPLGGNTVFFRRSVLDDVGGWDGDCLAEDCEIGVRLSALGRRSRCVYDAALVTREETPDTVRAFVKQRTRWCLGFMQVLHKGCWRELPTRRERWRAAWLLSQQYATAFGGLVLPIALLGAVLADSPVLVVLATFAPLAPTALVLAFEMLALHEFGRDLQIPVSPRDHLRLLLTAVPYQLLLAAASLRAVYKYARGDFGWEKTPHVGAHLELVPVLPVEPVTMTPALNEEVA